MSGTVRTESIGGQQATAIRESIATPLKVGITLADQFRYFTSVGLEPLRGVGRFGLSLRMTKSAQDHAPTINQARIGDEHHIRQTFHRLDGFDRGPSPPEIS